MTCKFSMKKKWVSTDGWRGYERPVFAVAGSSDTGTWEDSPCNSRDVDKDIKKMRAELKKEGICTKIASGSSSNVFMAKRWIVVPPEQFDKAKKIVDKELRKKELWVSGCLHDGE